ncbi:uncharacterized protein B0H18DRAFT_1215921 [Fomitopsis serialis]|uniref:uncharacterized protein n=1 Tax=Fomitopsis serialis TaxID=139415 RepID=UPI0020077E53|nr:uncharacterized protein B0H18DRAFT_1215921 [Neoantrodia serialis]KAH9914568.1 hypothetical protein B0H18DRAFT_1215921 [Neoantrodia serialis]
MASNSTASASSSARRRSTRLNPENQDADRPASDEVMNPRAAPRGASDDLRQADSEDTGKTLEECIARLTIFIRQGPYRDAAVRGPLAITQDAYIAPRRLPTVITVSPRLMIIGIAAVFVSLLASFPGPRHYVASYASWAVSPVTMLLLDQDPLRMSMMRTTVCTLPAVTMLIPTCRVVPEPLGKVGWAEFAELVNIQGSLIAGALDETSEHLQIALRLHSVVLKLHTTSQLHFGSAERLNLTEGSRTLLTSSGNATLQAVELSLQINSVTNNADYASRLALLIMSRVQATSRAFAGDMFYPSERWLVARLFQVIKDETRSSFMHISWELLATKSALLPLVEDLSRLEEHVSRLCWPKPLGRAVSVRRILHPNSEDTRCRDLTLALEMVRFDAEGLFNSVRELFVLLADSQRRLAELEEWVAQQETSLAPDLRYTRGHVAELVYNRRYVYSAKRDTGVIQPLRALVFGQ